VILNKTTINQRLFNQKGLDENMLLEFKELIAVYPYASIFAIAYLEGLKNSGDIHFEGELLKHAFKISNRQVLHQLLSQEKAPVEEEEEEEEEVIENIPIDTAIEIEEEQPLIIETEKVEAIRDELETLINSSVANTVFIKEFNEDGEKIKIAAEEAASSDPIVEQQTTKTETETSTVDVQPKSFNNWLKMADGKEKTEKEERTSTMIPIEKQKRDFYSPIKKAKESIDENKMPVSETLAKIFILQGNYPKAIYVYEQLILLYPEKKNIFATQIKHLSIKLIN
jgi:tetratricopeptide (TPR) repeat protein